MHLRINQMRSRTSRPEPFPLMRLIPMLVDITGNTLKTLNKVLKVNVYVKKCFLQFA